MNYPRMIRVKQKFNSLPAIKDISEEVNEQVNNIDIKSKIKPNETVAITAGSRGIANIDIIIRSIVNEIKNIGAKPFIVPAMGSHGNATAEGQKGILEHYGITERTMDCPVRSSMDTVVIGESSDGFPVFIDKNAYMADHIVVVNRVKRHTDFSGKIESGLVKMMAIGLGKRDGAAMYHKAALKYGFERVLREVADVVIRTGKVAFGMGIVENPYEKTAIISALTSETLIKKEEILQEKAKEQAAKLPFDDIDVLIVDEIGKDISGLGMDTKVIGRMMQTGEHDPEKPKITRIFVLDLTKNTLGNAAGIGLADFTTKRLVDKIDYDSTYMNFITSLSPQKVRIPIYFDTDKKVMDAIFETIGMVSPKESKVIRIKNTLKLEEVEISESLLDEAKGREDLEIIGELKQIAFDENGMLMPFES